MLDRTQNLEVLDEIADEATEPGPARKSGWRLSRRFLTRAALGVALIAGVVAWGRFYKVRITDRTVSSTHSVVNG